MINTSSVSAITFSRCDHKESHEYLPGKVAGIASAVNFV